MLCLKGQPSCHTKKQAQTCLHYFLALIIICKCAAYARQQAEGLERTRAFLPCITLLPTPSFAGYKRHLKSGSALRGWSTRAPSYVYEPARPPCQKHRRRPGERRRKEGL